MIHGLRLNIKKSVFFGDQSLMFFAFQCPTNLFYSGRSTTTCASYSLRSRPRQSNSGRVGRQCAVSIVASVGQKRAFGRVGTTLLNTTARKGRVSKLFRASRAAWPSAEPPWSGRRVSRGCSRAIASTRAGLNRRPGDCGPPRRRPGYLQPPREATTNGLDRRGSAAPGIKGAATRAPRGTTATPASGARSVPRARSTR
jgi:hypothetical protein